MTAAAICKTCIEDSYLGEALSEHFEQLECSSCGEESGEAVTVESLAAVVEPVLREYFVQGTDEKHFGENDTEWWEQAGDPLSDVIQFVMGQYFDFEDELVQAICDLDTAWPPDGEEPLWEAHASYVRRRMLPDELAEGWSNATESVKHSQRFFNPSARHLFERLFSGVGHIHVRAAGERLPVSVQLPVGTELYRARVCVSVAMMKTMVNDTVRQLGPPPAEFARAGRMNPNGIVVLYVAMDPDTARAELRPAIGNDLAVIKLAATRPLKVLDMARLESVTAPNTLSYFQPDYEEQVLKHAFLRRLHRLISQPVVPGKEADYLITQAMAEYLAHVHEERYDGIKFSSVQNDGGMNLVLFSRDADDSAAIAQRFGVDYVVDSIRFSRTVQVEFKHDPLEYLERFDGEPIVYLISGEYDDDMD